MGENRTGEMVYEEVKSFEVKRTQQEKIQQTDTLIPGLPNEIAVLCIARVRRSHHRNISGVCRSWRNLLHGRFLSKVRRELSLAEEWLYLWIETEIFWRCFDPSLEKWWKLPPMPYDNRKTTYSYSAFASVDGKLFVIGGMLLEPIKGDFTSICSRTVSYFDARSYCWKRAADLNLARAWPIVGIIDNQLYVFGGYIGEDETNKDETKTGEVYDPITNKWRFISRGKYCTDTYEGVVMGGMFYARDMVQEFEGDIYDARTDRLEAGVVYDARTDTWEEMAHGLNDGWDDKTTVLNGKLYTVERDYLAGNLAHQYEAENLVGFVEPDQIIQVYNPSEDAWEEVNELWSARDYKLVMKDVELITFRGKLCIISVETFKGIENEVTKICMVIFQVEDSTENLTCSVIFRDEFNIGLIAKSILRRHEICCQVVAL